MTNSNNQTELIRVPTSQATKAINSQKQGLLILIDATLNYPSCYSVYAHLRRYDEIPIQGFNTRNITYRTIT